MSASLSVRDISVNSRNIFCQEDISLTLRHFLFNIAAKPLLFMVLSSVFHRKLLTSRLKVLETCRIDFFLMALQARKCILNILHRVRFESVPTNFEEQQ